MRRLAGLLLVLALPAIARAQRPRTPGRGRVPTTRRAPSDTGQRAPGDTTKKDSTLYQWAAPDSVMQALMSRPGYTVTRYEGRQVTFDAVQRATEIIAQAAKAAAVKRGSQVIVSDSTIAYSEKTKIVDVQAKKVGGRIVLSDSTSGQADIVGHGFLTYNLARRTARITNPVFSVENGNRWYVNADVGQYVGDTANAKNMTFYGRSGTLTSCDDSIPDYHFSYGEVKRSGQNTLVARPAVLYIRDVPVMWLPFIFQDTRPGRHSGLLIPQFGLSDIIRNSPSYRRMVQNFGYYFALSDYMNASVALDWRSSAGATASDPGWMRYKGQWDYKWLDRFLAGSLAADYTTQSDGRNNLALTWGHSQQLTPNSSIQANINYVTSTALQRQNAFNPYAVLATITSTANYQQKIGPASLSIGGTRKQYPGRPQVDQTLPTLSLTTSPLALGDWLVWTPNLSFVDQRSMHMDQPGQFSQRYFTQPNGLLDSTTVQKSSRSTSTTFDTPLRIFGYDLHNSFQITDQANDFPEIDPIYDLKTGNQIGQRIFATTYRTNIDWTPNFQLPPLLHSLFNVTPSVSLSNVDPGPFWVRSNFSNGQFVHQAKRLSYGLSAAPSVFGFFPGFGPFSLIRHALNPTFSWSYAPRSAVDTAYLKATGQNVAHYLGALGQNMLSFGLSQNFEAKVKSRVSGDSTKTPAEPEKIKLLTVNFSSLGYDFQRASAEHSAKKGFFIPTNQNFSTTLSSELLPGFSMNIDYSLFQGSTMSDTAKFSPYRTRVAASFSMSQGNNPFAVLTRLFGRAVPEDRAPSPTTQAPNPSDAMTQQFANQPVAGMAANRNQFVVPPSHGWNLTLSFSDARPRPPVGGNIIQFDPKYRCAQYQAFNPLVYQSCLESALTTPGAEAPTQSLFASGPAFNIPATTSLQSNAQFEITDKWSATWGTTYDFQRHQFASHMVTLQRDLHDWRAIFGFTQSPNGNFAFTFNIALKADQDLKFNYNKATYRGGGYYNPYP